MPGTLHPQTHEVSPHVHCMFTALGGAVGGRASCCLSAVHSLCCHCESDMGATATATATHSGCVLQGQSKPQPLTVAVCVLTFHAGVALGCNAS